MSNQDLIDFSKEHIFYEIQMFHFTWKSLTHSKPAPGLGYNAMVESFALHARVLFDFFYPNPRKKLKDDDIVGYHYFESEEKYKEYFSVRPLDIEFIFSEVSKMAAHLTTFRIEYKRENKNWDLNLIKQKIVSSIELFFSKASPEKIGDISFFKNLDWNEGHCITVSCVTSSSIIIKSS